MIIDCHTHLGRNEHITSNVKDLLTSMDGAKIDKALVFAGGLNSCPNDFMLSEIAPHKDRLYGVAAVHPFSEPPLMRNHAKDIQALVDFYQSGQIVAVKFYLGYDHYYPSDVSYYLKELEKVGCPVIFHCGDCLCTVTRAKLKFAHPLGVDEVAVDYPGINFIIAHMGFPWHRDAAEVCYKNKNVYSDISGFVYKDFETEDKIKFKKVLDEFLDISSSDKLLFGTDFPISNQNSYLEALDWVATNTTNRKMSETFTPQYMTQNVKKAFRI